MAYISTEEIKVIRADLKAAFPYVRFGVRQLHHSTVVITILEAPFNFRFDSPRRVYEDKQYFDVYHTHVSQYHEEHDTSRDGQETSSGYTVVPLGDHEAYVFLRAVFAIAMKEWWDKSDIQTDYFNTAFYVDVRVGDYEHSFKKTERPAGIAVLEDPAEKAVESMPILTSSEYTPLSALVNHPGTDRLLDAVSKVNDQIMTQAKKSYQDDRLTFPMFFYKSIEGQFSPESSILIAHDIQMIETALRGGWKTVDREAEDMFKKAKGWPIQEYPVRLAKGAY